MCIGGVAKNPYNPGFLPASPEGFRKRLIEFLEQAVKRFFYWIFDVKGVLAPVFTPFNDSGGVDVSKIPTYMEYLSDRQINGVLVGGTTGEGMSLSVPERKLVLEAWVAAAKPFGAIVIAQVGGVPLPHVLELTKHAEEISVDAIMTLPELYYKPKTVDQVVTYLQRVSETAPSLPIIYYHFPMMTGVNVNVHELFQESSSKLPTFKGMKADLSVAEQVADRMTEGQNIFIANHHIAQSVLMGHESSIATVSNMFPGLVFNIISAVKEDVMEAKVLQEKLNKLVRVITSQGDFVPSMKFTMEIISGLKIGSVRPPLTPLKKEQKQKIQEALKTFKILE